MRKVMTFLKEAASVCKLKITLLIFNLCAEKELLQKEIVRRRSKTAHVANMAVKTGK